MQGVFRKLYMSILAATLILLTSIATTFAWVGMLTSSSLGSFDIDLKVEDLENDYYLKISSEDLTNCDAYGVSVAAIDVQKQIMDNMGIDYRNTNLDINNSTAINSYFAYKAHLRPVTTDKNLSYFKAIGDIRKQDIELYDSNSYFKFDLYLTVDTYLPLNNSTNINANVFFKNIEKALSGVECGGALLNGNRFKNMTVPTEYSLLPNLPVNGLKINSSDSTRLAFAIYDPIDITDTYDNKSPSNYVIYQRGTKYPTYNSTSGLYSFGGILPEEYNIAAKEIEKLFDIDSDELKSKLTSDVLERMETDKFMTQSNYHVWQSPTEDEIVNDSKPYLGIRGTDRTKMKITVYFWFEGWDADCMSFIDGKSANISIIFATDTKNNS